MDNLAIQRSLTVLEDRYRELLEMGETRFQALEAEKAAASKSAEELKQQLAAQTEAVQQAQKARDELMARVKDLEGETAQLRERLTALQGELEASQQAREEQAERLMGVESGAAQLKEQLTARQGELAASQQAREEQQGRLKGLESETAQLKEQLLELQAAAQLAEERGTAVEHLQQELQEARRQAAQLRQALQPQQEWKSWFDQEQRALIAQRARFNDDREAHAKDLRELEVLRAECTRRFSLIQQADQRERQQAARLKPLERELAQLKEQLMARQGELAASQQAREEQELRQKDMEAETSQLQQQLKEAAAAPALPAPELQALERQLQEAREDADLLLVQLHQVQEELEHYYLLWLNQDRADPQAAPLAQAPAPPKQDPQADTRVINSFRQRLLATT